MNIYRMTCEELWVLRDTCSLRLETLADTDYYGALGDKLRWVIAECVQEILNRRALAEGFDVSDQPPT